MNAKKYKSMGFIHQKPKIYLFNSAKAKGEI